MNISKHKRQTAMHRKWNKSYCQAKARLLTLQDQEKRRKKLLLSCPYLRARSVPYWRIKPPWGQATPFKMTFHNSKSLKKSNSVCASQRFELGGLHCIPIMIVFTLVERDLKGWITIHTCVLCHNVIIIIIIIYNVEFCH